MQVFFKLNLAILATPKTGSTALETALAPFADITFAGRGKHMNAGQFHRRFAPFLNDLYGLTPERVAVMREPLDHMKSWYRYRLRNDLAGSRRSTRGISFDRFIRAAISDDAPPYAKVGRQAGFLSMRDGMVPLHHLFAYETPDRLTAFLSDRFGTDLRQERINVSPDADTTISDETLADFHAARTEDFALYQRIADADGHLQILWDDPA